MQKGEIAFKELEEEIRSLKIYEKALTRECERNKTRGSNVDDIKRKIYLSQRELLQERTKVKALSEELENPRNLQRWRKLGKQKILETNLSGSHTDEDHEMNMIHESVFFSWQRSDDVRDDSEG